MAHNGDLRVVKIGTRLVIPTKKLVPGQCHHAVMSDAPYRDAPFEPSQAALDRWEVNYSEHWAVGPCPRCDHRTRTEWDDQLIALAEEGGPVSHRVLCDCKQSHRSGKERHPTCGAYWWGAFHPPGAAHRVTLQDDATTIVAVDAFEKAVGDQETRLHEAAEKWVEGVAAILALFGIAAVIGGGEILEPLSEDQKRDVLLVAGLALLFALLAILASYRAAFGWPRKERARDDAAKLAWYLDRKDRLWRVAKWLRAGVGFAVASVCLTATAAAMAWLSPGEQPEPTLIVSLTDQSQYCGVLLASNSDAQLRVRGSDGSVQTYATSQVAGLKPVEAC